MAAAARYTANYTQHWSLSPAALKIILFPPSSRNAVRKVPLRHGFVEASWHMVGFWCPMHFQGGYKCTANYHGAGIL